MFIKLSRTILLNGYKKSFDLSIRKLHSAVNLAFLKFPNNIDQVESDKNKNLIVLHGLFGSKNNWNSLCKAFAQKCNTVGQVLAIDARNHGESEHTDEHNYELMAEDIKKFMNDQNISKSIVLGHSMGGRAMIYFALKYPELVEKLIVVDISPVGRIGTTQSPIPLFIQAMQATQIPNNFTIHQGRNVADEKLKEIISEKSLRDFLITNLVKAESGEFKWRINLNTLDRCFQKGVAEFPDVLKMGLKFEGHTLFIGGSKSDYLKPTDEPLIQKLFPKARLEFLNAGHWVHAEKSEEFLNLTLKFLNEP